ncbi:MAG: hypothetical protein ACT4PL_01945, partial [Phycisphaerales bacterium]
MSPARTVAFCSFAPAALLAIAGLNATLLACPPDEAATAPASPPLAAATENLTSKVTSIALSDARALAESALFIDAREAFAHSAAQAHGIMNLPASAMTKSSVASLLTEHPQHALIMVAASSERAEAERSAQRLSALANREVRLLIAEPVELARALGRSVIIAGRTMQVDAAAKALESARDLSTSSVSAEEFVKLASAGYTVFDLRPRDERVMLPLTLPSTKRLSADEFVKILAKPGLVPMSRILIVDSKGESLPHIHQHLRAAGRSDFKLLAGGVHALKVAGFNGSGERAVA